MKVINQVMLHLQSVVMLLIAVFLHLEVAILIWPVDSDQTAMNHHHRLVQVAVVVALPEALLHHLVVLDLLKVQIILVMVVTVPMNHIHHNKHLHNKPIFKSFFTH